MKNWHIWDFPDTTYLFLKDDFRGEFFNEMFKKIGGKRPYARFLGLSQKTIKQYHEGFTCKRGARHIQSIPLFLFTKSFSLMNRKLRKKIGGEYFIIKS